MTDYELRKLAKLQAQYLAEAIKQDDELADILYPSKFLGIEEAAQFCGIPVQTMYKKISEIPHSKACGRLLFTERGLTRWVMRKPSMAVEFGIKKVI